MLNLREGSRHFSLQKQICKASPRPNAVSGRCRGRTECGDLIAAGIDHLDYAIRTAGAASSGATGQLAIGLISSITGGFVANLRARFRVDYPDVEQVVVEGPSAETVALVRNGDLDVALVFDPVDASDCHSRLLWSEPFLVALPTTHPLAVVETVTWADLSAETFRLRSTGAGPQLFEHIVRRMAERSRKPHVRRYDVGRDTLLHMAGSGEGVTLASETARHMNFPGVVLRPIADETESAHFSAIWSPHNRNPALLNLLTLAKQMSRSAGTV